MDEKNSDIPSHTIERRKLVLGGASIFSLGFIGGYGSKILSDSLFIDDSPELQNPEEDETVQEFDVDLLNLSQGVRIGSQEANIKFIYWFDFQCSFCHQFDEDVMDSLIRDYVQTEEIELIMYPINFFGVDSQTSAIVSYALLDLGLSEESYLSWKSNVMQFQVERATTIDEGWADVEQLAELLPSSEFSTEEIREQAENNTDQYTNIINSTSNILERIDSIRTPNVGVYNSETRESRQVFGLRPFEHYEEIINFIRDDTDV